MSAHPVPHSLRSFLLVAGLAACATTLKEDGPTTVLKGLPAELARLQPADIAVAPVHDQTGRSDVPVELFRAALGEALVGRLYSPLSMDFVDRNWVEASFRGTPGPDALLICAITRWDTAHLYSTGAIEAAGVLYLYAGGSTQGALLWGQELERTLQMGDSPGSPPGPSEQLIPAAVAEFAHEALAALPERDAIAAHAD